MIIEKNYPVFEDNQVLTSGQLNDMRDYLDQQERLTRVRLLGAGIACGFDVTVVTGAAPVVHISEGNGVTSEGYLITQAKCELGYWRTYSLPKDTTYLPFQTLNAQNQLVTDISMYELVGEAEKNATGVKPLKDLAINWAQYAVVLFLEVYDKDLKSCLGKSCDDIGIDRIFSVRKLLIPRSDIQNKINVRANNTGGEMFPGKYNLPDVAMPRPLWNHNNSQTYDQLSLEYVKCILSTAPDLFKAIQQSYSVFSPLLSAQIPALPLSFAETAYDRWLVESLQHVAGKPGVQYLYDHALDVVKAYREFCSTASRIFSECIINMDRFPQHLTLGNSTCPPDPLRQLFIESPIHNEQKFLKKQAIRRFKRLLSLLKSYENEPTEVADKLKNPVKITPDAEKRFNLGVQALPLYYEDKSGLESFWADEDPGKCSTPSKVPSWHNQFTFENSGVAKNPLNTPWHFDISELPFYRTEGHFGMPVSDAEKCIKQWAGHFQIGIRTSRAWLGAKTPANSWFNCEFPDLQVDYSTWRNKMLFVLRNLISVMGSAKTMVQARTAFFAKETEAAPEPQAMKMDVNSDKMTENPVVNESAEESVPMKNVPFNFKTMSGTSAINESSPAMEIVNKKDAGLNGTMARVAMISESMKEENLKVAADANKGKYTSPQEKEAFNLADEVLKCLRGLQSAMPVEFENFNFDTFRQQYTCLLRRMVDLHKMVASNVNSGNYSVAQGYIILQIGSVVLNVVDQFFIYPYITIASIWDIYEQRRKQYLASHRFEKVLQKNSGANHLAGVYPGQTLLQVVHGQDELTSAEQALHFNNLKKYFVKGKKTEQSDKYSTKGLQELFIKSAQNWNEFYKKNPETVVADFTIPAMCCDDCSDIPVTDVELKPLPVPYVMVVNLLNTNKLGTGNSTSLKILNDFYDPAHYKPEIVTQPKLGKTKWTEKAWAPDPNKMSRILTYTPDSKKVESQAAKSGDSILTDVLTYGIMDAQGVETGRAEITIFIVVNKTAVKEGTIKGTVSYINPANGQTQLARQFIVEETKSGKQATIDSKNGSYSISLPGGAATLKVTVFDTQGMLTQSKTITVNGDATVNFAMTSQNDIK
ncbi:MAG: hypothetical protein JNL57_12805 [Bacteroidetes bacterium]|nr:hypothetical protein [Bacteroidota bacterium]